MKKLDEKTDRKIETILVGLLLAMLFIGGCAGPNQQKGYHQDRVNYHTSEINDLNPIIFEINQRIVPQKAEQIGDTMSWQGRMKARMDAMKGGK